MVVFIICLFIILIFLIYLSIRNQSVCEFRMSMIYENYEDYLKLPSYNTMLYSFKPLKKKYWIKENLK